MVKNVQVKITKRRSLFDQSRTWLLLNSASQVAKKDRETSLLIFQFQQCPIIFRQNNLRNKPGWQGQTTLVKKIQKRYDRARFLRCGCEEVEKIQVPIFRFNIVKVMILII